MTANETRQPAAKCSCARNLDGTTTTLLCPLHADDDPCETMARITGKRRRGSIRRGRCSRCSWAGVTA